MERHARPSVSCFVSSCKSRSSIEADGTPSKHFVIIQSFSIFLFFSFIFLSLIFFFLIFLSYFPSSFFFSLHSFFFNPSTHALWHLSDEFYWAQLVTLLLLLTLFGLSQFCFVFLFVFLLFRLLFVVLFCFVCFVCLFSFFVILFVVAVVSVKGIVFLWFWTFFLLFLESSL